jgi:hypothetical protein
MRPSCGRRFFGNVQSREHLDARGQAVFQRHGRCCNFAQFAVDAHAHPVMVLVRLKVQVRGFEGDRLLQQLLDPVHNRRIVDRPQLLRVAEFVQHGVSMNNFVLKKLK